MCADSLEVLSGIPSGSVALVYVDPPFNTGSARRGLRTVARRDDGAARSGFAGRRYTVVPAETQTYEDNFEDYLAWLEPRLRQTHRILSTSGSLYFHIDPRESHYCKVLLDQIFGRESFLNEIVWAYDFGARARRRWPAKHDVIFLYARDPNQYYFDAETVDREPYMAPGLQTPERAARGKLPTDVWWHTIVGTNSRERTGYPTQKPLGVMRRIIAASSRPGDLVVDWCAGSGSTGAACAELGRRFLLVDKSRAATDLMQKRLEASATLLVSRTVSNWISQTPVG